MTVDGEEVFGWDGWSLGAGLPGPSIIADYAGAPSTGVVGSRTLEVTASP